MFAEFLRKDEFYKQYMHLFNIRLTIGNLEMEDRNSDITIPGKSIEMYNNMKAFSDLLERNPDKISPYDMIDVADDINRDINFFQKGFRKTQVEVACSKHFFPLPANKIPEAVYSAFNAYHNIWRDLPIYEREARLHIEIVRIQPFEDGNKRTARIITNFNLCKQNKAPVVISGKETKEYFKYIDEYNVEKFAEYLRKKSEDEFENMLKLYKKICGDQLSEEMDDELRDNDIKIYHLAKRHNRRFNN